MPGPDTCEKPRGQSLDPARHRVGLGWARAGLEVEVATMVPVNVCAHTRTHTLVQGSFLILPEPLGAPALQV